MRCVVHSTAETATCFTGAILRIFEAVARIFFENITCPPETLAAILLNSLLATSIGQISNSVISGKTFQKKLPKNITDAVNLPAALPIILR